MPNHLAAWLAAATLWATTAAAVQVDYRAGDTDPANNAVKPYLRVMNDGTAPLDLGGLVLRYYFSHDGSPMQVYCDWAAIGCSAIDAQVVQMAAPVATADHYLEVRFAPHTLAPGADSGEMQLRIHRADWGNLDESDDYSFDPSATAFMPAERVTAHQAGVRVWGVEPGGAAGSSSSSASSSSVASSSSSSSSAASSSSTASSSVASSSSASSASGGGFVSQHGVLSVVGGRLVDQYGQPIQLRGMSSFGLQWADGGPYMNLDSIRWLRDDWKVNAVRAAMYTKEGGYIDNPSVAAKVWEIVDAAIALDLYVVVDWHILSDGDPLLYVEQAKAFFQEVATRYGDTPNLIYEIANEPNGVTWSGSVKPYAEQVIPVIRAIDPDSVIIVGTPTWSQDVDVAAADPLTYPNVLYAIHFYACTHGQYLRDKVDAALAQGAAIFSSEWGTSAADGSGGNCFAESAQWLDFFDARGISWFNWSLGAKNETSAALKPGVDTRGGWTEADLSPSGQWVRERLRGYAAGGSSSSASSSSAPASSGSSSSAPSSSSASSSSAAGDCPVVGGGQSGNLGTTGAVCFRTADAIRGWGVSNFDGRTVRVTVDGQGPAVTEVGAPLPAKAADQYYLFEIGPGSYPWASVYWW
ncbi:MAG: hypothetical protein KatS3mg121_0775 [Gammaproteobacteria bacterium]|nr:MAG: hypothetical protein KatS3mg121_0775 [Gammaproteobacteria bacterium]